MSDALRRKQRILTRHLEPFDTDLCVNEPGGVWLQSGAGWRRKDDPEVTWDYCNEMLELVERPGGGKADHRKPLASGTLPTGERIFLVAPPATEAGRVGIAIRTADERILRLADMGASFARTMPYGCARSAVRERLLALYERGQWIEMLRLAIVSGMNIVIAGKVGTGKTTLGKAAAAEIPTYVRLVSIEDSRELRILGQRNWLPLLYDTEGGHGVTPSQLLDAVNRLYPGMLIFQEVRGPMVMAYLESLLVLPGSMTTVHANEPDDAFEIIEFYAGRHAQGQAVSRRLPRFLRKHIDLVVQMQAEEVDEDGGRVIRREVTEVWYRGAQ